MSFSDSGAGGEWMEFRHRTVLVTGAAQGIGAATAQMLARQGAALALLDRDEERLHDTAASLRALGVPVFAQALDLTDIAALDDAVATIEREFGAIRHLAHVAGILRTGEVLDSRLEDWDACMAINARAVYGSTRAVARVMAARGHGSIVVVGSNAATVPRVGMAAYAASKAAASQYLRCLALELAPLGIRCNLVSPGSTDTAMQRAFAGDAQARRDILDGVPQRWRLGIPLRRIADPQDIAEAVCFLLSDRARHITLHDLRVDGGATLDA
ncbi:2,3-dihydro-2,3-dihydroxybenzoate dehydrogenase [Montanilutibacter psychrotolerans]|nr:2,3-dihydro-2,3-dihydroxybenzoate dehydrogenase [Lysobacter psychrotolerans]